MEGWKKRGAVVNAVSPKLKNMLPSFSHARSRDGKVALFLIDADSFTPANVGAWVPSLEICKLHGNGDLMFFRNI